MLTTLKFGNRDVAKELLLETTVESTSFYKCHTYLCTPQE